MSDAVGPHSIHEEENEEETVDVGLATTGHRAQKNFSEKSSKGWSCALVYSCLQVIGKLPECLYRIQTIRCGTVWHGETGLED